MLGAAKKMDIDTRETFQLLTLILTIPVITATAKHLCPQDRLQHDAVKIYRDYD